jgi:maleylacetate reductase
LMAEESIRALGLGLPGIRRDPGDLQVRSQALYGAWLAGMVLGNVGMALHHKLCHVLGGAFGLPHAETHAVILPHAVAYNAPAVPEAMARIARALGAPDAGPALYELAGVVGAQRSLAALGMPVSGLELAVELALHTPYANPRPVERAALRALLERAFTGAPPRAEAR